MNQEEKPLRLDSSRKPLIVAVLSVLSIAGEAAANPVNVDPVGQIVSVVFAFIAIICFAVEVSLLRIFCRAFHEIDCDLEMTISFIVLNLVSWFVLLVPVLDVTKSVVAAEVVVVLAEAAGIRVILGFSGVTVSFRRAAGYSAFVNALSFLIGLLTQWPWRGAT